MDYAGHRVWYIEDPPINIVRNEIYYKSLQCAGETFLYGAIVKSTAKKGCAYKAYARLLSKG